MRKKNKITKFLSSFLAIVFIISFFNLPFQKAEAADALIATIPLGNSPSSSIPILVGTNLYVNVGSSDNVSVIDTTTNTVSTTIPVGDYPNFSTLVGTNLYVNNASSNNISVIDTTTNTVSTTIAVGPQQQSSVLDGTNLYVNNSSLNSVSVIDTTTNTVSTTIAVGTNPYNSTLVGKKIYVNNLGSNNISVIDADPVSPTYNTVINTITVGTGPRSSTLVGTNLYVNNQSSGDVSVIDTTTNTVSTTITVETYPWYSTLVGTNLYVNNLVSNTVSVIDTTTNTVSTTITVGTTPVSSVLVGTDLFLNNQTSNDVSVIDTTTNTVKITLAVGNTPASFGVVGTKLYVVNQGSNNVSVIDSSLIVPHTVTYTAGTNGSISGTATQTVDYGSDTSSVLAVADEGYHFVNWSDSSTDNPRTDTNVVDDINVTANFTENTALTNIIRVGVSSDGTESTDYASDSSISGDGRYAAFYSPSANLVTGDTNGLDDIFIHDIQTGITTRVSVATDGTQANNYSDYPSVSSDGRYVIFYSEATNLVAGDTNGKSDIFLHDTQTGITTRVSVATGGVQANNDNYDAFISDDGYHIVFYSDATNLVAGDTNGQSDIFLRDTQTDTTTRVSVATGGTEADDWSDYPTISSDGRYVAFYSNATNLVEGDTNGVRDIFLHDTQTNTTTRVSVATDGTQANGHSENSFISSNGRYVVFDSDATNLVAGDTNGVKDIFLHDTQTGITTRVSVATTGEQGDNDSYYSSISSDGRYVVFDSNATNLVAGDTNGVEDVFVRDTLRNITARVSVAADGSEGDNGSYYSYVTRGISDDGKYIIFDSSATNLVAGDTNFSTDTFVTPNPLYSTAIAPTLTTSPATSITRTTATLNGTISNTGGENATTRGFEYGLSASYGSTSSVTGSFGTGSYSSNISGLTCGTTYHFRSFATNSVDTSYGGDLTFNTSRCPSGSGSSLGAQVANLVSMGKTTEATQLQSQFSNTTATSFTFTKLLKYSMINNDVKELQKFLNTHGYQIAATGAGSPGYETNYFGALTKKAVIKFQLANKLVGDGIIGPKTNAVINSLK